MNALYDPCLYSYVALDHLSVYKKAPAVNLAIYVWPYLAAKTTQNDFSGPRHLIFGKL